MKRTSPNQGAGGGSAANMNGEDGSGNEDVNLQAPRQEVQLLNQLSMSSCAGRSDPTDSLSDDFPGSISSDLLQSDQEEMDRKGPIVAMSTAGDLVAASNPGYTISTSDPAIHHTGETLTPIHGSSGEGKNKNTTVGPGDVALDAARNALRRAFAEATLSSSNDTSSNFLLVNKLQQSMAGISKDDGHGDGGEQSLMAMLPMQYGIGQGVQQVPARQAAVTPAPSLVHPLSIRRNQQQMQHASIQRNIQSQSSVSYRPELGYSGGKASFADGGYASSTGGRTTESSTGSSSLSSAIGLGRFATNIGSAALNSLVIAEGSSTGTMSNPDSLAFATGATALSYDINRQQGERRREEQMSFPRRLMMMLDNPQLNDITRWLSHGKGFQIVNKKRFEVEVMPLYFAKKSKYTSFTRKMNRWNFKRVTSGPESGAYYHPMFQRGQVELCLMMTCRDSRSTSSSSEELHDEQINSVALDIATPGMINLGFVDKGGSNSGSNSTDSQQNRPFSLAQTPSLQALMIQQALQQQGINESMQINTQQQQHQQFERKGEGSQPGFGPSSIPQATPNATSVPNSTQLPTYSLQNFTELPVLAPPAVNVSGGIAHPPGTNISDIASAELCLRETERLLNAMQDQQPHSRKRQKLQDEKGKNGQEK